MVEPKTAIACRDSVELKICIDILRKYGHSSYLGDLSVPARIYICPKGYKGNWFPDCDDLMHVTGDDVDGCEVDEDDPFEWNYVEASDIFRNQIISARIKGGT